MIKTYKPKLDDLWFRQEMLHDEATMAYNKEWGGVIDFKEEDWADWYDYWIKSPEAQRYYRYLVNEDGAFIGEIAYHYDEDEAKYLLDVIIHAKYRHLGYGRLALALLCEQAKKNGIKTVYDNIAQTNPAIKMFLGQGFSEAYREAQCIYLKKEL